ncbi:porin [Paraburkholderia caballeronis]|uniref:Outer membrane protein (Porin) n=1 Tax=Paraburkholderia caballeronis TaxID=416943 RepID=A0A1H7VH13_9BURK|nr:porin [Paraburkholderia caballeronis]PXW16060.1 putative porin [Paraburkholderia caballeronis]PXW93962.1 putative porin [Paraburkholderia caballeronis]RAJ89091.1 putative porin [Paraburkholderia caballeronis]TDV09259.1 putative porin [Paraburkholderia caballeronis]TDV12319.1 putative porin [Paraburkholderia caballeronis]
MRKNLLAAGVIGLFAATAAHAQSSVTLYGSLDAGIAFVNNVQGGHAWLQSTSAISSTYFGLRGAEDLGGGLKAIFTLESGFNLNNGALANDGALFSRQAFVGLQSNQYGALTLGRQYDSVVDYLSPLAAAGQGFGNNLAGHPYDNDNLAATYSLRNTIKYASPNYSGFQFGGLYGFSNSGEFANNRSWSVGVSYGNGPFSLAAGYLQLNNDPNTTFNPNGSLSAANANIVAATQRTYGVGGNYTYGPFKVGLVWTRSQFFNLAGIASGGISPSITSGLGMNINNYEINGTYSLTPALALLGSYTFSDGKTSGMPSSGRPKWHTGMLAVDYSLSRRTDVYLAGVYQHATGSLGLNDDGSVASNVAAINTIGPSSTQNQVAATVGLRHRF